MTGQFYSVTQLGLDLGVSARTIRFYEDKGLVSPRRAGNNRVYTTRDRARMILILRGKKLGFTLKFHPGDASVMRLSKRVNADGVRHR